jgi:zinc transport system ATP-binding protein
MNEAHFTSGTVAIRFEDVSFSYAETPVLDAAHFHIHTGEFAALIGPNGAGKTTVLKLILGLARPKSGRVTVLGLPPETARISVGYVPQNASYDPAFPISVEEVVRMGRLSASGKRFSAADAKAVSRALGMVEVSDLAGRPYSALSGGQRKRVLVARALATEPRILILDEPTANMDAESEQRLYRTLGALKGTTTILVVTHDTGFVSALTDAVFCVGERGAGRSVIKHEAKPADHVASELYGGAALQVLHDTELPEESCCGGEADK